MEYTPKEIIPHEGEPTFTLRAQDATTVGTLNAYMELCSQAGCDPTFLDGIRRARNAFEDWQVRNSHLVKRPD